MPETRPGDGIGIEQAAAGALLDELLARYNALDRQRWPNAAANLPIDVAGFAEAFFMQADEVSRTGFSDRGASAFLLETLGIPLGAKLPEPVYWEYINAIKAHPRVVLAVGQTSSDRGSRSYHSILPDPDRARPSLDDAKTSVQETERQSAENRRRVQGESAVALEARKLFASYDAVPTFMQRHIEQILTTLIRRTHIRGSFTINDVERATKYFFMMRAEAKLDPGILQLVFGALQRHPNVAEVGKVTVFGYDHLGFGFKSLAGIRFCADPDSTPDWLNRLRAVTNNARPPKPSPLPPRQAEQNKPSTTLGSSLSATDRTALLKVAGSQGAAAAAGSESEPAASTEFAPDMDAVLRATGSLVLALLGRDFQVGETVRTRTVVRTDEATPIPAKEIPIQLGGLTGRLEVSTGKFILITEATIGEADK